jgi:hypothetical protein
MISDFSMRVLLTVAVVSVGIGVAALAAGAHTGLIVFGWVAGIALGITAAAVLGAALVMIWSEP